MAWTSFTSYMNGLFQSPAAIYWGTLIDEPFSPSDRMLDLTVAIFYKHNEDGAGITPQVFNRIRNEFSLEALDAGAEELPPKALRELAICYYTGQNLEYRMRLEEDGSSIPLLTRLGFMYWVCYQLLVVPEATLKSLNKLLAEAEQPLKNQKLDKPFTHTTIPNECLPKVQQATIENIIRVSEAWKVSRTKIIDKHREEAGRGRPGPYSRAAQKAVEVAKDKLETSGTSKISSADRLQALTGISKLSAADRLQALTNTDSQRHPRTTSPQLNEQQQHLLAQQQQMAIYQQMSLQQQQRAAQFAIQMRLQQAEYASMQNAANSLLYSTVLQSQASVNASAIQSWGIF